MKKTYIAPVLSVEHVQTASILAASVPEVTVGSGNVEADDLDVKEDQIWDF